MPAASHRGTLYLIPTPLGDGDLGWILPAEIRSLIFSLDTFVVEHPKTARHFLKQIGTQKPLQELTLLTLNEHTKPDELAALLAPALHGKNIGLISEAGCPAIADPGANLVRLAHAKEVRVMPLVGPSSILLALMGSGLNGQRFAFHGYLPAEKAERIKAIKSLEKESLEKDQTQVFIETPYRNLALFQDIVAACEGKTWLCVAAELTSASERIETKRISDWRMTTPDINKKPIIFLLYAGNS
jgi:16S rRNA (cytidine1402-2'-O)-methyltransferase